MTSLNQEFVLRDLGYSNTQHSIDLPRHRWYLVKEAFAPQIVEKAIEDAQCEKDDIIIDPFAGSGTVPLTASLRGFRGVGFEVNPFLAFLSNTKLLQVEAHALEQQYKVVVTQAKEGKKSSLESFSTFSEAGGAERWLFNQEVLRTFEGGWNATITMPSPIRNLLQLGLLGAAMDTCNAFRDGKCLRYIKGWEEKKLGRNDFLNSFEKRISEIKEDLETCPNHPNRGEISTGDVRYLLKNKTVNFKLCVTSPPYLNSFDYTDVYRPELFLGKFVCSQEELRQVRQETIRSHVQAKWAEPKKKLFWITISAKSGEGERKI